jgi:hypothetical protein
MLAGMRWFGVVAKAAGGPEGERNGGRQVRPPRGLAD